MRSSLLLLGMPVLLGTLVNSQISSQSIAQSPTNDWLTYHGDYSGRRFSPLREINPNTVSTLVPKWLKHFDTPSDLEVTPLVASGVIYVTTGNELYALDAVTGREIWHYRSTASQKRGVNRGAALLGDSVFFTTTDCHLLSLRQSNGAVLWDQSYASSGEGYSCSSAPLAVKDKLIVGVASSGKVCYISARAASDGKEAWRVWAVPQEGQPGAETWGKATSHSNRAAAPCGPRALTILR